MIKLRKEHMDAFRRHVEKHYRKKIFEKLKPEFPETFRKVSPYIIDNCIESGVERAKAYGITSENDIYQFLRLIFAYGPDFDRDETLPWASIILKEKEVHQREPSIQTLLAAGGPIFEEKVAIA